MLASQTARDGDIDILRIYRSLDTVLLHNHFVHPKQNLLGVLTDLRLQHREADSEPSLPLTPLRSQRWTDWFHGSFIDSDREAIYHDNKPLDDVMRQERT